MHAVLDRTPCHREGLFRHRPYCSKFYRCVPLEGRFQVFTFNCVPGLAFDETISACTWPESVPGCEYLREVLGRRSSFNVTAASDDVNLEEQDVVVEELPCTREGFFRDLDDCSMFYRCVKARVDGFRKV